MSDPQPVEFPDDMPLGDARGRLRGLADAGHECPCCRQHVKVYRRPLSSVAARALVALWRVHRTEFGHLPTVVREHLADVAGQGGYTSLAQHWRLIEEEVRVRPDGGRAGYWRVTPAGVDWVLARAAVPKYARLYDGRCLGLEGPAVTVGDVLGERFDLAGLLAPDAADGGTPDVLPLFDAPRPATAAGGAYADAA